MHLKIMRFVIVVAVLGLGLIATQQVASAQANQAAPPAPEVDAKPKQTLIRISKETTRELGPLNEKGFVDYIAAANAKRGKGVTPANNGAFDFVRIMDPDDNWGFHEILEIDKNDLPPPFQPWHEFVRASIPEAPPELFQKLFERREALSSAPWKTTDQEMVATWLKNNQVSIDMLVESTKKPRFFTPWTPSGEMVISVLLPAIQECREVSRTLIARAMLRLGEGDNEGAWNDLQAIHRMARQIGSGPTLIERLVAVAIETVAFNGDVVFIQKASLSPEEIGLYPAQFAKMSPLPSMASAIDDGERVLFLDATQLVAQEGLSRLRTLVEFNGGGGKAPTIVDRLMRSSVDWNETLTVGNEWYDRCVKIAEIESVQNRDRQWKQMEQDMDAEMVKMQGTNVARLLFASKKTKGRHMSTILAKLLIPAIGAATNAESRARDQRQLTVVAFAMEAYRERHGIYPKQLEQLTPLYVKSIPQDLFAEGPYKYETNGEDYRLYGVGSNFKYDDGSSGLDDVVSSPGW